MLIGIFASGNAPAVPVLQLYIEGATYDAANESWYYPGHDFRLWTIANITGPGGTLQLTAYAYSVSDSVGYIVGGYRYPQSAGPGGRFVLALHMGPEGRWLIAADLDNTGPRR